MNVLALVPKLYDTSPGQRFRIEQWAPHLERAGIRCVYAPFETPELHRVLYRPGHHLRKATEMVRSLARRVRLLWEVERFDLVYLFREATLLGPPLIERAIAHAGVPIVYDFDDAVWLPYTSPVNRRLSRLKCVGKTATVCRLSRHVMAGNETLAEYARAQGAAVSVVPTTIDTQRYTLRPPGTGDPHRPVIGWTGSHSTVQHLDTLRGSLALLGRGHRFRLGVVGAGRYAVDGVEVEAREWSAAHEVRDLSRFDIGVMPLPDDPWSRGKCGLKLLQYMALGIPVVASPVGVNAELVRDGVNGFLAETQDEWVERLSRLLLDPQLRWRMGAAGRRIVEEHYSAHVWAPRVASIFRSAARRPVPAQATFPREEANR